MAMLIVPTPSKHNNKKTKHKTNLETTDNINLAVKNKTSNNRLKAQQCKEVSQEG